MTGVPTVAAIVLAAGQGTRMGGSNKLLVEIEGRSLIRRAVDAALASQSSSVWVVTGHRAQDIEASLAGAEVHVVWNADYASGLSTSLRTGVAGLGADVDGAVILLGDMPLVSPLLLDRMIEAFAAAGSDAIIVPVHDGQRGNPVLWPRRFFPQLGSISGDKGARELIGQNAALVIEVTAGMEAVIDLDTPEAVQAAGGTFPT